MVLYDLVYKKTEHLFFIVSARFHFPRIYVLCLFVSVQLKCMEVSVKKLPHLIFNKHSHLMEYVTEKRVQSKWVLINCFLPIHGVINPTCF